MRLSKKHGRLIFICTPDEAVERIIKSQAL